MVFCTSLALPFPRRLPQENCELKKWDKIFHIFLLVNQGAKGKKRGWFRSHLWFCPVRISPMLRYWFRLRSPICTLPLKKPSPLAKTELVNISSSSRSVPSTGSGVDDDIFLPLLLTFEGSGHLDHGSLEKYPISTAGGRNGPSPLFATTGSWARNKERECVS